jgi:cell division protein FtsN
MPQLVKVIPAPVYYSPVTTIPVVAAPAYCPPVTVPVVTAPVYCPPAASVPIIVAPARQIQTQCPPGLSTYPAQVYTVPAPQAYRQIQPQPSYAYTQPQQQYIQPQQQYVQPQQQYVQPQQQYAQPQQQYVQPQQAAPQVQVYTSPSQTAQPPVTVYTAPTQTSPVTVYTAPSAQPQAQTYSTGAAVIKPNMPDPSSAGVYRVQVGSYIDPQNAQAVAEALARVGLSPAYEQYGQNWRVVLPGISAQQLNSVAQYLGAVGIQEAWIRLEG